MNRELSHVSLGILGAVCFHLAGFVAPTAAQPSCAGPEIVDGVVVEDLQLSGNKFHPCYEHSDDHEPICLEVGQMVKWTCSACARGQGQDLDFMVLLQPTDPLTSPECLALWTTCETLNPGNPGFAHEGFTPPGTSGVSPFDTVEVDAPRIVGAIDIFEVVGDGLEVEAELEIPRISAKGFLQAGPVSQPSRGYCYKLDYILYDAETGVEVDRVDPHIVGGI